MTVNAPTFVSLEPSAALARVKRGSRTGAAIRQRKKFGSNVLAGDQCELSQRWRRFDSPQAKQFTAVHPIDKGAKTPFPADAVAHLNCKLQTIFESGEHEFLLGAAVHCDACGGLPTEVGGRFRTFKSASQISTTGGTQ